jgi:hypothetical protein
VDGKMTAIRQEIQGYINELRDEDLRTVLRPLCLRLLYGRKPIPDIDEPLAIETDLTDEEKAIVAQGKRERAEHPESYISLTEYINSRDGAADV